MGREGPALAGGCLGPLQALTCCAEEVVVFVVVGPDSPEPLTTAGRQGPKWAGAGKGAAADCQAWWLLLNSSVLGRALLPPKNEIGPSGK